MWSAYSIVVDDRVFGGRRPDKSVGVIEKMGFDSCEHVVIGEEAVAIRSALELAIASTARVIITVGGTGVRPTNVVPELTHEFVAKRLYGVETQVLLKGLESTNKAGLTRGIIGVTDKGQVIVNCPSSTGGVTDTLSVVAEVMDAILRQLDEADQED